jgi:hypothetical protein
MDIGSGWTALDKFVIASNKLACNLANGIIHAIAESGKADCDITIDVTMPAAANYYGGLVARYQDDTHRWMCGVERDGNGTPYILLMENATQRGKVNVVHGDNVTKKLRITCVGNDLKVYWDDLVTPKISYTSTLYNDKTKHGILGFGGSGYVTPIMDTFIML